MQREEVDVWLCPGLAVVEARFELDNRGDARELEVGFPCLPVGDPFTPPASALRAFAVHVDGQPLPTSRRDHDNREFPCWHVWTQTFPPARTTVVEVRYWVPLISYAGVLCVPFVYVLRTGRFWQGSIGEAIVRVHREDVPVEAIVAATPEGSVREGESLVWRFVDLDPQQDIGLLVSPFAVIAAKIGVQPYHDIVDLHARRPEAGTTVVVGGYFGDDHLLNGERRRDRNIVVPAGLHAHGEGARAGVLVRNLEHAQTRRLKLPGHGWRNRALIRGRVAYEGTRLVIEAELRVDVEGVIPMYVPKRFPWVADDELGDPWTRSTGGRWPVFLRRVRPRDGDDDHDHDDHGDHLQSVRATRGRVTDLLVRVVGNSMQPRLEPGDLVLALPWLSVRVGDIVLARVDERILVKEVARISSTRIDLREWGTVPHDAIVGRVVLSWPPRRRR